MRDNKNTLMYARNRFPDNFPIYVAYEVVIHIRIDDSCIAYRILNKTPHIIAVPLYLLQ